ncbi:MAG: hypothetical protein KAS32_02055 [Candidatus Peribacteraceae bacterium]|nr:hypothetical protein [Candidatus Peribacteraceae bacterium]
MSVKTAEHRPYQISFDNQGGHKKLENGNFLSKLARLAIKTQPYNGKSKTIESAFGRFQQQFLKREWFFTGQNITTKTLESKANLEFINANKADLPTLAEIKEVYKQRRQEWNEAPHPTTGIPRIEMYRNSKNEEAPKISMWDMVDLFWIQREKSVMYSAYGLSFTEKKVKYTYAIYAKDGLPDMEFHRNNIDQKFYIKYDPEDMSLIYLYEKDALGLRFVTAATTKVEIHRGKQEQEAHEPEWIAKTNSGNKDSRITVNDTMDSILADNDALPEQQGLKSPKLRGINSKRTRSLSEAKMKPKKKRKVAKIEDFDKAISNMVLVDEHEDVMVAELIRTKVHNKY